MSSVNFVTNNYFCRIDKLNWDIRNDILEFGDSLNQSSFLEFVSTSSTEDSLSFEANYAKYDLTIDKLEIYGINSWLSLMQKLVTQTQRYSLKMAEWSL